MALPWHFFNLQRSRFCFWNRAFSGFFWSDIKDELKKQQTPTSEEEDFSINSMSDNLRENLR